MPNRLQLLRGRVPVDHGIANQSCELRRVRHSLRNGCFLRCGSLSMPNRADGLQWHVRQHAVRYQQLRHTDKQRLRK